MLYVNKTKQKINFIKKFIDEILFFKTRLKIILILFDTIKIEIISNTIFCLLSDYRHSRTGRIREMVWE